MIQAIFREAIRWRRESSGATTAVVPAAPPPSGT
jgi:hypothetical protein